jgi:FlaA1/EpsC-like NDP-sugar epimerase
MALSFLQSVFKLSRWKKRLIMMLADVILIPLAFWMSFALRLGVWTPNLQDGYWLIVVAVLVSIPVFIKLGLYRAVIRFLGSKILNVVFIGISITTATLVFVTLFADLQGIPRSVFFIFWGVSFLFIGGSRYLVRRYYHAIHNTNQQAHVAIYGAGHSGAQLAQSLSNNADYQPVLFLDDNKSMQKSFIHGLKVYPLDNLDELIERYELKQVLLAMPAITADRRREIIQLLEPFPVHVRTIPGIEELVSGQSDVEEIREIEIDDLLGRTPVSPDPVLLARCIKDKNVLVTGAGGSIGSELCRQIISAMPKRLILFERSEYNLYTVEQELIELKSHMADSCELISVLGSVLNEQKMTAILQQHEIHTLYHAAAYKHVPLVEHNPVEGIQNNVLGTFYAANAAFNVGIDYFVLISTDKAVRPTNVMGASKRMAELGVQAFAQKSEKTLFSMVRFGNVLGSSGSVVPLFRKQIHSGGPVTVTHPDIIRYFMTIPESAQLVIQAGAMAKGGEVFLLDMGEPVKIIDLARQMIHLTGLDEQSEANPSGDIAIEFTGLRPGEKLFEELLIDGDAQKTAHPRVFQTKEKQVGWDEYQKIVVKLQRVCEEQDEISIYSLLKKYVSGYNRTALDDEKVIPLRSKLYRL